MSVLKIKRAIEAVYYIFRDATGAIPANKKSDKELWLVSERGFDARDNAYHLYKWMCYNHPEIDCIYVIGKNDTDYKKIKDLPNGKTVRQGSSEHFRLMCNADALVSTHAYGWSPNMPIYAHLVRKNMFKPKGVQVFLQHGVSDKDTEWLYYENFKPDLFIVSTYPEEKIVKELYKQPDDAVALTGMCRFDNLTDESSSSEKLILFMPTWRQWLSGGSQYEFIDSDYYLRIQKVLENETLQNMLKQNNTKLLFYPHIEMQKYIYCFAGGDNVEVLDASSADVQDLLKKSNLLITDYSSVYFDFLYMNKPILFYQWDKPKFTSAHYKGVLSDYESVGFVSYTKDDLIEDIKDYFEGERKKGADSIFKYHDTENCKRVFEEIEETIKKNKRR